MVKRRRTDNAGDVLCHLDLIISLIPSSWYGWLCSAVTCIFLVELYSLIFILNDTRNSG